MPEKLNAADRQGVSRIAEEFRELETKRRREGLARKDVDRYHSLFARLSDALESGERKRRMDARQFLRVPFEVQLVIATGAGERTAPCRNFGGGGCSIDLGESLRVGDELSIAGALIQGVRYALSTRSRVVWARGSEHGLQFALRSAEVRDQIDRVLYRILDLFLRPEPPEPSGAVGGAGAGGAVDAVVGS